MCDVKRARVVGASVRISETADPLGFSHTTVSRFGPKKKETSHERTVCRLKHHADEKDQRRTTRRRLSRQEVCGNSNNHSRPTR